VPEITEKSGKESKEGTHGKKVNFEWDKERTGTLAIVKGRGGAVKKMRGRGVGLTPLPNSRESKRLQVKRGEWSGINSPRKKGKFQE